jgi:hypothetical protein
MANQDSTSTEDHRRFQRIDFVDAVQIVSDDVDGTEEQSWQAKCLDVSMRGMLLEVPEQFSCGVGAPYELHLMLSEDVIIEMPCTLVHIEGQKAGFRAETMSLDSMTNLRRLLELNFSDNDEVERELTELIEQSA